MSIEFVSFPQTDAVVLLRGLWRQAHTVEIAAGYFFGSGLELLRPEIEAFLDNRKNRLRILVADSFEQTDGEAVQALLQMREDCVRFFAGATSSQLGAPQPGGIFHPKSFCFHLPEGRCCLLGSANFSYAAWRQNIEWGNLVREDAATCGCLDDLTQEFSRQ